MLRSFLFGVTAGNVAKIARNSVRRRSDQPTCPSACQGCESGRPEIQGCNTFGEPSIPDATVVVKGQKEPT